MYFDNIKVGDILLLREKEIYIEKVIQKNKERFITEILYSSNSSFQILTKCAYAKRILESGELKNTTILTDKLYIYKALFL